MLKKGFTLAEVLITLGIIGVISALTLPGLLTDTASAQIGPKLAKARAMFDQANQALLHDLNLDSYLNKSNNTNFFNPANNDYFTNYLSAHLKVTDFDREQNEYYVTIPDFEGSPGNIGDCALSSDGMLFCNSMVLDITEGDLPSHRKHIGTVFIDINGKTGPNLVGTDVFVFKLSAAGSLIPVGATNWDNKNTNESDWRTQCPADQVPANTAYCAGHIFENDLKVLYK